MEEKQQFLQLVEDPVARTTWMLKDLPLESSVTCLEMAAEKASRLGLLSKEDKTRITDLLAQVLVTRLEKAA